MLAYTMIGILSVLAFLCISHAIPALARRKTLSNSPSEVAGAATDVRYTLIPDSAAFLFGRNIASSPSSSVNNFPRKD